MKTKSKITKEQLEEMLNEHHRYFPLLKYHVLSLLYYKPRTILDLLNEDDYLRTKKKKTAESMTVLLYKYRKQGDAKRNKDAIWKTTKKGVKYLIYLNKRIKLEFHSFEGFEQYVLARREEAKKRKEEENAK